MGCNPQMPQAQREGYRRVLSSAIRLLRRREPHYDAWAEPVRLLSELQLQICGPEKTKSQAQDESPSATP